MKADLIPHLAHFRIKRERDSVNVYKLMDLCISLSSDLSIWRRTISAYCENEDLWIEIDSTNLRIKIRGRVKCDTHVTVTEYCWCGIA